MKFVRVFALLIALTIVLSGINELFSVHIFQLSRDLAWLAVVKVVLGIGFGFGAYVFTTEDEDY